MSSISLPWVPLLQALLSRILGFVQLGVIGVALAGEHVAQSLGVAVPEQYLAALREKRMVIIMGAWFVGNMIHNSLSSTGAFEVFYDGQLVRITVCMAGLARCPGLLSQPQPALPCQGTAAGPWAHAPRSCCLAGLMREANLKAPLSRQ